MRRKPQGNWFIALSFLIALFLMIVPLPDWAAAWRPLWVVMVLIYWCMATPERIGLVVAWLLGLSLDVLHGMVFGVNALGLTLLAFAVHSTRHRMRTVPVVHQAALIFFYLLFYGLLTRWMQELSGARPSRWDSVSMASSSMILWPWLFIVLRDLRRKYVS